MKLVRAAQLRERERRVIEERGVSAEVLMERAGRAVAEAVRELGALRGCRPLRVRLAAGKGNNGGDAFAAARHLRAAGADAEVWLAGTGTELRGAALHHAEAWRACGGACREKPAAGDWAALADEASDVLVDGLLGTGAGGAPRGVVAAAIEALHAAAQRALVVAIDLPSGLDPDTGTADGAVARADRTVTLGLPKVGLVTPTAWPYVGHLDVAPIGLADPPPEEAGDEVIAAEDLRPLFPRRPWDAHKGRFGHVLVLGGARGYSGAAGLASAAALRSGAGLVTAVVPRSIADRVACAHEEVMVWAAPETEIGSLSDDWLREWLPRLEMFDAVLVGPGLTTHHHSQVIVQTLLEKSPRPLVLDADALNVLESRSFWLARKRSPVVITPHPGEMARVTGRNVPHIQAARRDAAVELAGRTDTVVVLKGAGTVVTSKDGMAHYNVTGNPGMATAGAGDVLAGLLAGLLAQGLAPLDAARAAVYLHGTAGDRVAWRGSQAGLVAGDLVSELPAVQRQCMER